MTDFKVTYCDDTNDIHVIAIDINGTTVLNVYKPPAISWPREPLPIFPHPCIYNGDFNSHHEAWGYGSYDTNGNSLVEWMSLNELQLIYSPKDPLTFKSPRWGT